MLRTWMMLILAGGIAVNAGAVPKPKDARPLVLVVIAPVAYHEGEIKGVQAALKQSRIRWVIGSTQGGTAQGMMQGTARIGFTLDQLQPENFDGMIILGGSGAKMYLWFNADLNRLIKGMHKLRRPMGAVSIAPAALAYAGVLTGRRASVLPAPEIKKLFEKNQVQLAGGELTVDGRLVTAGSSEGAAALAKAVAGMLPRYSKAKPFRGRLTPAVAPTPKPTVTFPVRKPGRPE